MLGKLGMQKKMKKLFIVDERVRIKIEGWIKLKKNHSTGCRWTFAFTADHVRLCVARKMVTSECELVPSLGREADGYNDRQYWRYRVEGLVTQLKISRLRTRGWIGIGNWDSRWISPWTERVLYGQAAIFNKAHFVTAHANIVFFSFPSHIQECMFSEGRDFPPKNLAAPLPIAVFECIFSDSQMQVNGFFAHFYMHPPITCWWNNGWRRYELTR